MSKYDPLKQFLVDSGADCITKNFDEVTEIIGTKLPVSAFQHRAWWSNNKTNNAMTQAWLEAGYITRNVDMEQCTLEFLKCSTKGQPPGHRDEALSRDKEVLQDDQQDDILSRLAGSLKGTVTIYPGTNLTDPIDEQWNALK